MPCIIGHGYGHQVVVMPIGMPMPPVIMGGYSCKYCYEVLGSREDCCEVNSQSRANMHRSSCPRVLEFEENKRRDLAAEEEKRRQAQRIREEADRAAREAAEAARQVDKLNNAINYYQNLNY